MGKKSVNTNVKVPGIGKGVVVSPPKVVRGEEVQDVWIDHTKTVQVPTKDLK
jgi:hypothetical protein